MDRYQTKNIYAILGLTAGASKQAIKAAFRRLTMQYHPDRNPGNACVEQHFKTICNAYRVLMLDADAQTNFPCTNLQQERRSRWRRTPSNRRYNWRLEEGYKGTHITTHA